MTWFTIFTTFRMPRLLAAMTDILKLIAFGRGGDGDHNQRLVSTNFTIQYQFIQYHLATHSISYKRINKN